MPDEPRKNGGGSNAWTAASISSAIVLALCSAFGSQYARDQARDEQRLSALEQQRALQSEDRGRILQKLDQLTEQVVHLDEVLQREMRLLDDATTAQVNEMDRRLQGEMATHVETLGDRISAIRASLEALHGDRWTKEDQRRFEDKLGLGLVPGK